MSRGFGWYEPVPDEPLDDPIVELDERIAQAERAREREDTPEPGSRPSGRGE